MNRAFTKAEIALANSYALAYAASHRICFARAAADVARAEVAYADYAAEAARLSMAYYGAAQLAGRAADVAVAVADNARRKVTP